MNTALSATMGARIRELRTARRWSQSDLARQIGVQKATVGQYESGDRSPSYEVLIRIADVFAVSTDYLIRGNGGNDLDALPPSESDAIRTIIAALLK